MRYNEIDSFRRSAVRGTIAFAVNLELFMLTEGTLLDTVKSKTGLL